MKKLIFTLCMIFLSLSFGCDYLKSEKLSQEKKLELAEKCSKAGKTYFDDFIRRNLPEGFLWDEPEYHYSTKLNTCLIHIRYVSPGKPSSHRNQVIETVPKKSEKCFLENQLKTKSLIVLKLSFIYQKHWALNNWFIWPLIRLIKK